MNSETEPIVKKPLKTYVNMRKNKNSAPMLDNHNTETIFLTREPLSTKKAVELLLGGMLKNKVCRYCLNIAYPLMELDQILQVGGRGSLYKVTIRDMVATFHPFQVLDDPNFPNKICNKCLNQTIRSYLFAQQCEQAQRAIRNYFDDMYQKFEKLDPLERPKKRGRQKLNPNHNILYTEHQKVMDYAEPIRNLINSGSETLTKEPVMTDLECKKCWQILPNVESLVNHENIHPKNMWYHCRECGRAFSKRYQINRHIRLHAKPKPKSSLESEPKPDFECKQCGLLNENFHRHLQHIEKHKFHMVLEHLVERNMHKLCSVCLNKQEKMVEMDKVICLHGGYPELTGDRSLYNILGATVPEMNTLHNYTGKKICEQCLDYAITSYVFINRTHYIRNRLDRCITAMLDNLNQFNEPEGKIFIEIAENGILPINEYEYFDDNLLLEEKDEINEAELRVEVLEDEFRMKSDSDESDIEMEQSNSKTSKTNLNSKDFPVKTKTKENIQIKVLNGYQSSKIDDVCSEFLTFKSKRKQLRKVKCKFTCPVCSKHFISDYFLKRHVLKHLNKKVQCSICLNPFKSKFHLYEHMKINHFLNQTSYSLCKICGRAFTNEQKMISHELSHVTKQCQLCSKLFVSQKYYDSHMQRHATKVSIRKRKNVQTCSFCEKECLNNNQLSIHVNKVHLQIKPYGCDMCERQFYTESNLKCHKRVHTMKSKEKCEFCSKILKSRKDLVIHVRKHIGMTPYKCLVCPQAFHSESKVNNHMKKWHGGRFCCRLCKKVFVNRRGLKTHVNRAHSVF